MAGLSEIIAPGGTSENVERALARGSALELLGESVAAPSNPLWLRAAGLSEPPSILGIRELTVEEVAELPSTGRSGSEGALPVSTAKAMRARHHEVARLMAAGSTNKEIHQILGVAPTTISLLKRNPAFQQLLAYFMSLRDVEAVSLSDQIRQTGALGVDALQEKLEKHVEGGDQLSTREIIEITTLALDRSGHGPQSKVDHRNLNVTADFLNQLKASANAEPRVVYSAEELQADPDSRQSAAGKAADLAASLGQNPSGQGGKAQREALREVASQSTEEIQLSLL